jgi:hypothetical protein
MHFEKSPKQPNASLSIKPVHAVCAMRLLVFAFDDGEDLQHGVHVVAPDAVEVTGSRISLRWKGASCNTPERVILNPIYAA